jgi:hypothetical protein
MILVFIRASFQSGDFHYSNNRDRAPSVKTFGVMSDELKRAGVIAPAVCSLITHHLEIGSTLTSLK